MEHWLSYLGSAVAGALTAGVPLWYKFKRMQLRIKEGNVDLQTKEHTFNVQSKIDSEAEWKRIIEYRDAELVRLREKDEQQEKKIQDLYEKHIECRTSEARQGEQLTALNKKVETMDAERLANTRELIELRSIVVTLKAQLGEMNVSQRPTVNSVPPSLPVHIESRS